MIIRRPSHHWYYLPFILILGGVFALWLMGWSFFPFGKKHLPDYYFNQLHEHHKNYFPEGDRLILLNGFLTDSIQEKQRVGVTRATRIIEYSGSTAIKRFGDAGKYGATEIVGEEAEWIVSDSPIYQRKYSPGMMLTHTNVPLPSRVNPGPDAILAAGESTDTLYLGTARYRHVGTDTIAKIVITPHRYFFANAYKRKSTDYRQLLVFRYGRQEASFFGVDVASSGTLAYAYDDRVIAFGHWVDNTVSAVMKRHRKTDKVKDSRLLVANGMVLEKEQPLSRIQATQGIVTHLNGIDAVKMYGWKGRAGAVEVTGNSLKFFGQSE